MLGLQVCGATPGVPPPPRLSPPSDKVEEGRLSNGDRNDCKPRGETDRCAEQEPAMLP